MPSDLDINRNGVFPGENTSPREKWGYLRKSGVFGEYISLCSKIWNHVRNKWNWCEKIDNSQVITDCWWNLHHFLTLILIKIKTVTIVCYVNQLPALVCKRLWHGCRFSWKWRWVALVRVRLPYYYRPSCAFNEPGPMVSFYLTFTYTASNKIGVQIRKSNTLISKHSETLISIGNTHI